MKNFIIVLFITFSFWSLFFRSVPKNPYGSFATPTPQPTFPPDDPPCPPAHWCNPQLTPTPTP